MNHFFFSVETFVITSLLELDPDRVIKTTLAYKTV